MSWTWPQITEAAASVRAYHTDLAASLWSGKSPALSAAKKAVTKRRARQELVDNMKAQRPELKESEVLDIVRDQEQLRALSEAGFAVRQSKPGETPDLFKIAAELKADPTVPKAPPKG